MEGVWRKSEHQYGEECNGPCWLCDAIAKDIALAYKEMAAYEHFLETEST